MHKFTITVLTLCLVGALASPAPDWDLSRLVGGAKATLDIMSGELDVHAEPHFIFQQDSIAADRIKCTSANQRDCLYAKDQGDWGNPEGGNIFYPSSCFNPLQYGENWQERQYDCGSGGVTTGYAMDQRNGSSSLLMVNSWSTSFSLDYFAVRGELGFAGVDPGNCTSIVERLTSIATNGKQITMYGYVKSTCCEGMGTVNHLWVTSSPSAFQNRNWATDKTVDTDWLEDVEPGHLVSLTVYWTQDCPTSTKHEAMFTTVTTRLNEAFEATNPKIPPTPYPDPSTPPVEWDFAKMLAEGSSHLTAISDAVRAQVGTGDPVTMGSESIGCGIQSDCIYNSTGNIISFQGAGNMQYLNDWATGTYNYPGGRTTSYTMDLDDRFLALLLVNEWGSPTFAPWRLRVDGDLAAAGNAKLEYREFTRDANSSVGEVPLYGYVKSVCEKLTGWIEQPAVNHMWITSSATAVHELDNTAKKDTDIMQHIGRAEVIVLIAYWTNTCQAYGATTHEDIFKGVSDELMALYVATTPAPPPSSSPSSSPATSPTSSPSSQTTPSSPSSGTSPSSPPSSPSTSPSSPSIPPSSPTPSSPSTTPTSPTSSPGQPGSAAGVAPTLATAAVVLAAMLG